MRVLPLLITFFLTFFIGLVIISNSWLFIHGMEIEAIVITAALLYVAAIIATGVCAIILELRKKHE